MGIGHRSKTMDSDAEFPRITERNIPIRDTIALLLEDGEFIHIETTKARLADSFAEYAAKLGFDGRIAKTFFEEKVCFKLGKIDNISWPQDPAVDRVLAKGVKYILRNPYAGIVLPLADGRYSLTIDTQLIARYLPKLVRDYPHLTLEERAVSFQQVLNSFTGHELMHLLQFMTQPETVEQSHKQAITARRIGIPIAVGSAAAITSRMLFPAIDVIPAALPVGAGLIWFAWQGMKGTRKIEREATDAQNKGLETTLINKPFSFIHESNPKLKLAV